MAPCMRPVPAPSPHPAPVPSSLGLHPSATADLRWCPGVLGHSSPPSQGRGLSLGPSLPPSSPLHPLSSALHCRFLADRASPSVLPHVWKCLPQAADSSPGTTTRGTLGSLPGALDEPLPSSHAHPLDLQRTGKAGLGSLGSFKEKQGQEFMERQHPVSGTELGSLTLLSVTLTLSAGR